MILVGEHRKTYGMAFSPNSERLIAGDASDAHVWDLSARVPTESPLSLRGHHDTVNCVAFTRDSRYAVTGSEDRTVRIWDLEAPSPSATARVLSGYESAIESLAISSDGRWLASGSHDPHVHLWDLASGEADASVILLPLRRSWYVTDTVYAMEFSADNHWLVTGSVNGTVRLWNLRLEELMRVARRTAGREFTDEERRVYRVPSTTGKRNPPEGRRREANDLPPDSTTLEERFGARFHRERLARLQKSAPPATLEVRPDDVQSASPAASVDRTVIDWCRSINGQVWVSDDGHVTRMQLVQKSLADDDLARLKGLKQLVYLNLGRSGITDGALEHLRDLTNLDSLLIADTRVTGPGLKALAGLASLRILALGGPLITDATLEQLPPLENLRNVLIVDSRVTDEGVKHLRLLTGLRVLNLSGSSIGDASIDTLGQLGDGKLEVLRLEGTKITAAGAARLRAALPDCEIHH